MTIDEAIKVLKDILTNVEPGDPPEEHDAIRLGIEALKQVSAMRKGYRDRETDLLQGEAEE